MYLTLQKEILKKFPEILPRTIARQFKSNHNDLYNQIIETTNFLSEKSK